MHPALATEDFWNLCEGTKIKQPPQTGR